MRILAAALFLLSGSCAGASVALECAAYAEAGELTTGHPVGWIVWVFPDARPGRLALREMGLVSGPLIRDIPLAILQPRIEIPPSERSSVWSLGRGAEMWAWCRYAGMDVFQPVPARATLCYSKGNESQSGALVWCDLDDA